MLLDYEVSKLDLPKLFKNSFNRSLFIAEYLHFGNDDNADFYIQYIDENIDSRKIKAQEDALELSIASGIFKPLYFEIVKKIINSKRSDWIKLLCVDWLFSFYNHLKKTDFIEINEYLLKTNTSELIKTQSILNLLLYKNNEQLILTLLFERIHLAKDSTVYYRLVNGLNSTYLTDKVSKKIKQDINRLIETSSHLTDNQKNELILV
ncbi:MAG: hypothetical protein ABIN91_13365 [Mucilaginibacter sp.]|uniref:hypothetical protein n=1 Tax=Mucilaginibacter sp. TaxID=1882438 RepID=UPI003265BD19